MHRLLCCLFCLELAYVPVANAEPLFARPQALSQFFRLSSDSVDPRLGSQGEWSVKVGKTWSNYWAIDKRYTIDGQTTEDRLQLNYNLLPSVSLQLGYSQKKLSGLPMDDVAIGFHNSFGIQQDRRLEFAKNRIQFSIPDYGLDIHADDKAALLAKQLSFKAIWKLALFDLASFLAVEVGTDHGDLGLRSQGVTDVLLQAGAAFPWRLHSVFINSNYLRAGSGSSGLFFKPDLWSARLGYSYQWGPNTQWSFETFLSESPFLDIGQLSEVSYEIHTGFIWKWHQHQVQAILIENVFWPYNTPDWGFSIAIGTKLAGALN